MFYAASVSSPGGGRDRFWYSRLHRWGHQTKTFGADQACGRRAWRLSLSIQCSPLSLSRSPFRTRMAGSRGQNVDHFHDAVL